MTVRVDVEKAIKWVIALAVLGSLSVVGWAVFGLYKVITWVF